MTAHFAGPAGPTINPAANDPQTTKGGIYAPQMVQRFTEVSASTLKIFYTLSTWNPYAVVLMESDFTIAPPPLISAVVNAESGSTTIAPNTWVEIAGTNLSAAGDSRGWYGPDFVNNAMPTQLDNVSATVNGKSAYVAYISPTQVNILTPPDALNGPVQIVLTNNGTASPAFTAQTQSLSPSFFVFNGGPYIAGEHANGALIGPVTLYPGQTTPAQPGEVVELYASGFEHQCPCRQRLASRSPGTLSTLPVITIGGVGATVQYAGLVGPGEYQFNVMIPQTLKGGDQLVTATYGGASTQSGAMIAVREGVGRQEGRRRRRRSKKAGRQKTGGRRQEAGDRRQEAEGRRQGAEDRRQETEDREAGGRRQEAGGRPSDIGLQRRRRL